MQAVRRVIHNPFTRFRRIQRRYRRRFRMRLDTWFHHHQNTIAFSRSTWMGVPAIKNPLDTWIYQMLIAEIRPDVILEIGSYAGGSTLYFAHVLDALNHGIVISLDIDRSIFQPTHE